jgi:hypothetical protein
LTRNRKGHDVPITQPGAKLPETDAERLSDYDGSLVVFANAKPGERDTSFGARETREVLAYVVVSGEWKALGETPIFFKTVIKQIDEADGEPLGGILKKGTERNANEWAIVPTTKKADLALLDNWTEESGSEPF